MTEAQSTIARRLRRQAESCLRLGSPLYHTLLEQAADDVLRGGPCWMVLKGHDSDPAGSVLALRFMGGVHRLVLEGQATELARYYPSVGGDAPRDQAWPAFCNTVAQHGDALRESMGRSVQTNEVGRCAALLGGFLLVAQRTRLPLRLLEIGASAGLNLRWDYYRYETEGAAWGDPDSPMRMDMELPEGKPPVGITAEVVERRGCDVSPVDPCSTEGRLTLMSYIWADQVHRFERLRGAIEVAQKVAAVVEQANAPDWLAAQLSHTTPGIATVVFHSIVMQYLTEAGREHVRRALERAGESATVAAPLAWLRMEPGGAFAQVRLTIWPGGEERLLATAGYHGPPVRWLNSEKL